MTTLLLRRILAASAAACAVVLAACGSSKTEEDLCYTAGGPDAVGGKYPALPCAPKDKAAQYVNPGCTEGFTVLSGPTEKATGQCCYHVEYERIDGCQVGRPLGVGGGVRVAGAVVGAGWG